MRLLFHDFLLLQSAKRVKGCLKQFLLMNQSRISQLLSQSRSRHEYIRSPQLKKLSREWFAQKRRSQQSTRDLRKMMSQMSYLQTLNSKLNKGILKKGKVMKEASQVRQRYSQDVQKKHELRQKRTQEMLKNRELANRIKQDRLKKIKAVKQSFFERESIANYYRLQARRLREMRDENYSRQCNQNKSRVEQILEFQCNLRESAIRKKQKDNMSHINAYRASINTEQQNQKLNQLKSIEIKKRLRVLTDSSIKKLRHITDTSSDILKYKSPNGMRLKKRELQKMGCQTQKTYTDRDYDSSSIYISQYNAMD